MRDLGVLIDVGGELQFQEDVSFRSISAAAQTVSGTTVNGRVAWQTQNGKTYADWESEQSKPIAGQDPEA